MRYLITQSLLSAWNYVHSCYEGCEEDAMASFLSALRKEPSEVSEAMQNGIEFENEVYAQASGQLRPPHPKWEHGICQVASLLTGAQFQVRVQREIDIDGMTFLVYGVLIAIMNKLAKHKPKKKLDCAACGACAGCAGGCPSAENKEGGCEA